MSAIDSARRSLQRTATIYLKHLETCHDGARCSHAEAKHYHNAREVCGRIELELLEQLQRDSHAAEPTPTERYLQ